MKKFLTLLFAAAMALSLSMPAVAQATDKKDTAKQEKKDKKEHKTHHHKKDKDKKAKKAS
jgi:Ni/Co efflux regulator RcnB